MNNEKLEKEIALLRAKSDWDNYIGGILDGYRHQALYTSDERKWVNVTLTNKSEFADIISKFPVQEDFLHEIGSASQKEATVKTYRINFDNPPVTNSFQFHAVKITYQTTLGFPVTVVLPINEVKEFVTRGYRKITDSEHHYFIGRCDLHRVEVIKYEPTCKNKVRWYGGDYTVVDEEYTDKLIKHILHG